MSISSRRAGYLTLAMILCCSFPNFSSAEDGPTLTMTAPADNTANADQVLVYDSATGPVIADSNTSDSVIIDKSAVPESVVAIPEASITQIEPPTASNPEPAFQIINEPAPQLVKKQEQPQVPAVPAPTPDIVAQPIHNDVVPQSIPVEAIEDGDINSLWQTQFIRGLTGNDGVLSLELQAVDQSEHVQESVRLDEAVSIALQNNNELKAAIAGAKSKEWDTLGTYSQYLPSVNLDVAVGSEDSRPASYNDNNGDRVLQNNHLRRDRSLLVRQPIMDLGIIADIFSAKDKQGVADIDKLETQDTVALGTVTAYLKLLQSQVAIQLADQYRVYLDGLTQVMQARVDAGGATAADLDRVVSRSTLAESARMEAVGEFEINLAEFKRLTGVMPMKIIVPSRLAPDIPTDMSVASKRAYVNNPGYLASLKKIDVAQDERHKTYSTLVPKVYAQYSGTYSYNAGGAANANPIDGVYATQRTDTAMIVAQWSINGLTPIAGALSAQSKENQSYFQSLDIRKRMDQAIGANYTAVSSTKKRLAVLQKTVEANERVVQGFEAQYKSGTRSLFDLLDAYEQLYNSRLNLTRVIFAYTLASFQIRQQMGEIVPSIIDVKG